MAKQATAATTGPRRIDNVPAGAVGARVAARRVHRARPTTTSGNHDLINSTTAGHGATHRRRATPAASRVASSGSTSSTYRSRGAAVCAHDDRQRLTERPAVHHRHGRPQPARSATTCPTDRRERKVIGTRRQRQGIAARRPVSTCNPVERVRRTLSRKHGGGDDARLRHGLGPRRTAGNRQHRRHTSNTG
jgi:hypothetical protein